MNRDLIRAYLPSAYEGTVQGGPMPSHTGEAFRMGLGMGADFSGFDSWSYWEGAIDEETAGGDGQFWHYFWHGERQLLHNPWLIIDKRGNRQPYFAATQELFANPGGQMGDLSNCAAWMSAVATIVLHMRLRLPDHRVREERAHRRGHRPQPHSHHRPEHADRHEGPRVGRLAGRGRRGGGARRREEGRHHRGAGRYAAARPRRAGARGEEYNELCEGAWMTMSTPYDPRGRPW
ncbi:MAG: hypothetical protein ACLTMP_10915 [Eggerthella lenta]